MRKNFIYIVALALVACNEVEPVPVEPWSVSIEPVITRATEVNFEPGDRIGLDIVKADGGSYAANAMLSYDGKAFTGDLKWYSDASEECSLKAYYPYAEGGFPSSFTVGADQTSGAGAYDLMLAVKQAVAPQEAPVAMVFQHQLSQVVMTVNNQAGISIEAVTLKGLLPTELFSFDAEGNLVAVPDGSATKIDITAEAVTPNLKYRAIVVPQTMSFSASVKAAKGGAVVGEFPEVTMKPGYTYTIEAKVTPEGVAFSLAGEIKAWDNGGVITPGDDDDNTLEEHLEDGYFIYAGERYKAVKLKDGKWWMAENLRYLPSGIVPSSDLGNVTAGVYYPVVLNADHSGVEFCQSPDSVRTKGYLYQIETALGLAVGSLTSVEAAEKLEGAQGICPEGWHVPSSSDILGLVGKSVGFDTVTSAPYYDKNTGNGSTSLLYADGFDAGAFGCVSISDNTKTSASLTGWLKACPDIVASGFVCGSSFAGVTYNTKDDPSSGVKNLQFYGFMPMLNNGTYNGSKLSYRMAASLRCVRDKAE